MLFHKHKWKIIGKKEFTLRPVDEPRTSYHLQCEICGNVKEVCIWGHVKPIYQCKKE